MEAKDTVIPLSHEEEHELGWLEKPALMEERTRQAERTWPIAFEEGRKTGETASVLKGRKEVVEWIREHADDGRPDGEQTFWEDAWQAQLKAWGVQP